MVRTQRGSVMQATPRARSAFTNSGSGKVCGVPGPQDPSFKPAQEQPPAAEPNTIPTSSQPATAGVTHVGSAGERLAEDQGRQLGRTRLSGTWTGVAVALVLLVMLLVFMLLNLNKVDMNFYGAHVHAPLAVALLFAVVLGSLLVFGLGAARILQVRLRAKRTHRP